MLYKIFSFKNYANINNNQFKMSINFIFLVSFFLHLVGYVFYLKFAYKININNLSNNLFSINFIEINTIVIKSDFIFNILNQLSNYKIGLNTINYFSNSIFNDLFKLDFIFDFFGLNLVTLAYIIGYISILTLDTRLNWRNIKYLYYFNIFIIIVYLYVTTNNILILFLCYEFLMIPSFLIIYYLSNSRRSIQSSLYFLMWTQLGSFLVLIAISYIIFITNYIKLSDLIFFKFTYNESIIILSLLFLGFGFKVPIWPFHYWLTKTHVEAPSGFSIYLSGFLVKSALYGFYKIFINLSFNFNMILFITLCIFGVIDSSLKMWGQTDLKKLVAYGTIQEMNLIFLSLCFGDSFLLYVSIIFTITHSFLSALMFFLVDCIYRRFNSRSIIEVGGLNHIIPNYTISVVLMIMLFSGLPGSIKFISEFCLFSSILDIIPYVSILLIFTANALGLIGFSKVWFNCLFGSVKKNTKNISIDLSLKELYIILINIISIVFLTFLTIFIF